MPPEARQQLVEAGCIEDEGFTLDSDEGFLDELLGEDTDESASAPARSEMSLDDHAAACPQYDPGELAEDATNGEVATATERWIQVMESIQPPPEVADWHWESVSYAWSIEDLADARPQHEVANPFVFQILLPQLDTLEDLMNSLDPDVRALLAGAGCLSDENASGFEAGSLPSQALASPAHPTYAAEGSSIRLSWDAVDGADHYNVYYDNFFDSSCSIGSDAEPAFCAELATNLTEPTYVHTDPDPEENYYWVAACNRHGCSLVDSENPARPIEPVPSSPTNLIYAWEGSKTVVSWDAVVGADHYNVYHDSFFDSSCSIGVDAGLAFCSEPATNLTETTYVHADPDGEENYYWVTACNRGGCSQVDARRSIHATRRRSARTADLDWAERLGVTGQTIYDWRNRDLIDRGLAACRGSRS